MKKKTQKGLLVGAIVLLSVTVVGVTAGLINAKTGAIDRAFTEEKASNGHYNVKLVDIVSAKSTTEEDFTQNIKVEDEASPFAEIQVDVKTYADSDHPAVIAVDTSVECSYIEEVKLTFSLKENVDYYIGSVAMTGFDFTNADETESLGLSVEVGNKDYDGYLFSDVKIFMNKNTYSDDIVVTIKNPLAGEKKIVEGKFELGEITFNYLDTVAYTAPSISE